MRILLWQLSVNSKTNVSTSVYYCGLILTKVDISHVLQCYLCDDVNR